MILCTHNSARSQMAEGILRARHGERYEVASAGSRPTSVHPLAMAVMEEIGVDISNHRSKDVREFHGQRFDYVVTLCEDDGRSVCPFFPRGKICLHQRFPDPGKVEGTAEEQRAAFRSVRDALGVWIETMFGTEGQVA